MCWPELDFLDLDDLLLLARFGQPLSGLRIWNKPGPASGDRWRGIGRNDHQIEALLLRFGDSLASAHDTAIGAFTPSIS